MCTLAYKNKIRIIKMCH